MSNHTPGPWTQSGRHIYKDMEIPGCVLPRGILLATCRAALVPTSSCSTAEDMGQARSNARLIAVTPTMLSLLERFDALDTDAHATDAEWSQFRRDVHALFAQIRGGQL